MPGSQTSQLQQSMLVKNCYVDRTVSLCLEKDRKQYPVTAIPKALSLFLNEDIFSIKDSTDSLKKKLLLLNEIDSQLSQNGKIVVTMKKNKSENDTNASR